jgi:flavin reductase (DIM6/NTAB) family NADH-FMN oxidoreductase RutF
MRFDLESIPTDITYKLLSACVLPRPIAWITTLNQDGGINAAPYSFFNMMGSEPPTIAVGMLRKPGSDFKDTARNIAERGEFVVNMVTEALAAKMNETSIDAPPGVEELKLAGLTTAPSKSVAPPRISESPIAFECRSIASVMTGPMQTVVIGRVLAIEIDGTIVKDADRGHLTTEKIGLIGRTFASGYVTTRDRFELDRPTWSERNDDRPISE